MEGFRLSLYRSHNAAEGDRLSVSRTSQRRTLCLTSDVGYDLYDFSQIQQEVDDDSTLDDDYDSDEVPLYHPHHTFSDAEDDYTVKEKLHAKGAKFYDFTDHVSQEEAKLRQKRCLQNLLVHSLSVMLISVPNATLQHLKINLINHTWGFMTIVTSCILAPLIVQTLGYKRTMLVSYGIHILFVLANLVPWGKVVFPVFLFVGLTVGPFWTAQGCFVSALSSEYAEYAKTNLRATTCAFFGMFFMFYHFSKILARPLAYYVLDADYLERFINSTNWNELDININSTAFNCGRHFCRDPDFSIESPVHVYNEKAVMVFTVIYLVLCFIALLIKIFFVDDVISFRGAPEMTRCELLRSTVYMHCKEMLVLMIPLLSYVGFQQMFLYKDFLRAFVRCNLSFRDISPVIFCISLTEVCATLVIGFLQKYPKCRMSLMEIGSLINIILLGVAKSTDSDHWQRSHFYTYAIFWAICDAIWQTSTCAMVSLLFPHCRGPAFATHRLWQSVALGVGYTLHTYVCVDTQLTLYICLLVLATLCYTVMERRYKKRSAVAYIDLYSPVGPGNDLVTLYVQRFLGY